MGGGGGEKKRCTSGSEGGVTISGLGGGTCGRKTERAGEAGAPHWSLGQSPCKLTN